MLCVTAAGGCHFKSVMKSSLAALAGPAQLGAVTARAVHGEAIVSCPARAGHPSRWPLRLLRLACQGLSSGLRLHRTVMGRPAGLEARAGKRDWRSFPMNASARIEMEAEAGSAAADVDDAVGKWPASFPHLAT